MTARKLISLAALFAAAVPIGSADDAANAWPGFRGRGNSHTDQKNLPVSWSESENLAWRAELSGFGQSSPVIWKDRVYVTGTRGDHKETLLLEAIDLKDGTLIWKKEFPASQTAARVTEMISRGAPTPAADADGVYAFFESGDLLALDHEGEIRWKRQLTKEYGKFIGGHGVGSSLVNAPDSLVLLIEHDGPSYLLNLDKSSGENRWKIDRDPRVSWTTPTLARHDETSQIIVSSNGVLESFRLEDGQRLWWLEGIEGNTVASPSIDGDLVVIGSSAPQNSLAVRLGGSENIAESHLAWRAQSVTSSFGSPLIHRGSAYFVNRAGALQATDINDGSLRWERRLPGSCWASPLAAGDRLYFFCKDGQTVVMESDEAGEVRERSINRLPVPEGDRVYGYAVAPGQFVIRISRALYSIREAKP